MHSQQHAVFCPVLYTLTLFRDEEKRTVELGYSAGRLLERLLQQHAELQESNILLSVQVEELTQERDALLSRLGNARERLEALLERLPAPPNENADAAPAQTSASLS